MTFLNNIVNTVASYGIGQYGKGNIDLYNRPQHKNEDGSISTVASRTYGADGKYYLLPSVSQSGSLLNREDTWNEFNTTGQYLGVFDSEKKANKYGERLHIQQERIYDNPKVNVW